MSTSIPKLFQPIRVGTANLQHRVVMAPMSRTRADDRHVHGPLAIEYYRQRTSVPGTLAIAEATYISPQAGGMKNVPGIWSDEQISGWLPVRHPNPLSTSQMGHTHIFTDIPDPLSFFMTDCGRGAQKRIIYIPPNLCAWANGIPGNLTRRRWVPTRCTQSDSTRK